MSLVCCIPNPDYYDEPLSKRVQQFASDNPLAAQNLCEHIVKTDDYDEMYAFLDTMKQPDATWNVQEYFNVAEPRVEPEPSK